MTRLKCTAEDFAANSELNKGCEQQRSTEFSISVKDATVKYNVATEDKLSIVASEVHKH